MPVLLCVCTFIWGPEIDIRCLLQSLPSLCFKQGLLLILGLTDSVRLAGYAAVLWDPFVSAPTTSSGITDAHTHCLA